MKSQTISKDKGFTLIEMMLVVALITILGGLGLYFGLDSLRGYSFRSDRDVLASVLQHARAEAVSNVCRGGGCQDGKPHGVAIKPSDYPDSYVIFQGSSYDSRTAEDKNYDAIFDAPRATKHGGSVNEIEEIVFDRLSGNVNTPGEMTLIDATGRTSVISINSEGQILWSN